MYRWMAKTYTSWVEEAKARSYQSTYKNRFGEEPDWLLKEFYRAHFAPLPGQTFDNVTGGETTQPTMLLCSLPRLWNTRLVRSISNASVP